MNRKIYLMPWARELDLVAQGLLAVSPGSGYNNDGNAGNDMNEDDDYNYSF